MEITQGPGTSLFSSTTRSFTMEVLVDRSHGESEMDLEGGFGLGKVSACLDKEMGVE